MTNFADFIMLQTNIIRERLMYHKNEDWSDFNCDESMQLPVLKGVSILPFAIFMTSSGALMLQCVQTLPAGTSCVAVFTNIKADDKSLKLKFGIFVIFP